MSLSRLCRKSTLFTLIALLGSGTVICRAQNTVSNTSSAVATTDTNWSSTLTVPQFNSTQGTLQSVTVTLNWNAFQEIVVSNTDGASGATGNGTTQGVYADEQVAVSTTLPNSTTLSGGPPDLIVGALNTDPNATLVQAPSGASPSSYTLGAIAPNTTFTGGPLTTSGSVSSATFTDSTTLAAFTGTGIVSFATVGNGSGNQQDSGGNVSWSVTTQAGATVTVVYTYAPTTTSTLGCITGALWNNKSGDGVCGHAGEGGLHCSGVKINICDCLGKFICCVLTDDDGTFTCEGLKPGCSYRCCIDNTTLPQGYCLARPCCTSTPPTCAPCYWPSCWPSCCPVPYCWPKEGCPSGCDLTNICSIVCTTTPATGCITEINFPCVQPICSGSFTSLCQSDWQSNPLLCLLKLDCLDEHYCHVYPTDRCFQIGCQPNCCLFNAAASILCCFTQSGNCCPLPLGCLLDPKCNTLGSLCGELQACQLNCDFSDASVFKCNFKKLTCQSGPFKGCTVEQCCFAAHCYLTGCKCLPCIPHCTPTDLCTCLHNINTCYGPSGEGSGNGFCK